MGAQAKAQGGGEAVEVIRFEPKWLPEVLRLLTRLWSTDVERNREYFAWKFEQHPFTPRPVVYLGIRDGRAVAMRSMHSSRWKYGARGTAFCPLIADDLVVDPSVSNRRVVSQVMRFALADAAFQGHRYVLNLSGGAVTVLGSLAMGWRSAGFLEPMVHLSTRGAGRRVLRERLARTRVLWRFSDHRLLMSAAERSPFAHLDRSGGALAKRGPIRLARIADVAAMEELFHRCGHDGRLRHVRHRDYLAWRFRNPLHEYRFVYWGRTSLEGYLVLQRSISDLGERACVQIADVQGLDPDVESALLDATMMAGEFAKVNTWTATCPAASRARLKRWGFVPEQSEGTARGVPCLLVRPTTPEPMADDWRLDQYDLLDLANWDVRLLDSMRA